MRMLGVQFAMAFWFIGAQRRQNLKKIEMAQRRIIRAILFKKSMTVYKIFCGKPSSIQFLNCSLWMYSERSLIS